MYNSIYCSFLHCISSFIGSTLLQRACSAFSLFSFHCLLSRHMLCILLISILTRIQVTITQGRTIHHRKSPSVTLLICAATQWMLIKVSLTYETLHISLFPFYSVYLLSEFNKQAYKTPAYE